MVQNDLYVILADKNLGLTVVDKSWYHTNMQIHFANSEAFEEVDIGRPQPSLVRKIGEQLIWMPLLTQMENKLRNIVSQWLPYQVYGFMEEYWSWNSVTFPQSYGLIKLHKSPPKLRYITPVVDWINVKVAKYVATWLQKYVDEIDWILSNSTDLIRFVEDQVEAKTVWIGSWDVQDMYNQIDQEESIAFIKKLAAEKGWWKNNNHRRWSLILDLIQWVFDSSYVSYNGRFFKQVRGLPMGSPLSPVVANLYMAALEYFGFKEFNTTCNQGFVTTYRRYLDDIVIIVQSSRIVDDAEQYNPAGEQATSLLSYVYAQSDCSNINMDTSGMAWRIGESIDFLDLKLRIVPDGRILRNISCSVFDKPTNLHIYTDPSTFFPLHYIYSWIQGENIRFIRNSSDETIYKAQLDLFKEFLFRRKYLEQKVERYLALNVYSDREQLLRGEKPHQIRKQDLGNKKKGKNVYIMLENSGARGLITSAVKLIDQTAARQPGNMVRYLPTVRKGKSILSVMNKTRKQ
jgi:hypothetical protein